MWKLIVSEWKKIFRSRLNIFLLLFLIGYTLFSMCSYTRCTPFTKTIAACIH